MKWNADNWLADEELQTPAEHPKEQRRRLCRQNQTIKYLDELFFPSNKIQ